MEKGQHGKDVSLLRKGVYATAAGVAAILGTYGALDLGQSLHDKNSPMHLEHAPAEGYAKPLRKTFESFNLPVFSPAEVSVDVRAYATDREEMDFHTIFGTYHQTLYGESDSSLMEIKYREFSKMPFYEVSVSVPTKYNSNPEAPISLDMNGFYPGMVHEDVFSLMNCVSSQGSLKAVKARELAAMKQIINTGNAPSCPGNLKADGPFGFGTESQGSNTERIKGILGVTAGYVEPRTARVEHQIIADEEKAAIKSVYDSVMLAKTLGWKGKGSANNTSYNLKHPTIFGHPVVFKGLGISPSEIQQTEAGLSVVVPKLVVAEGTAMDFENVKGQTVFQFGNRIQSPIGITRQNVRTGQIDMGIEYSPEQINQLNVDLRKLVTSSIDKLRQTVYNSSANHK